MSLDQILLLPPGYGFDGAAWTPASLSSLALWFDPDPAAGCIWSDAGTTIAAVDDPVYRWKATNAATYVEQATLANRPILRQGANGKYYLEFDGTNDYLGGSGMSAFHTATQANHTIAALLKRTKNAAYQACVTSDNGTGAAGAGLQFDNGNKCYSTYHNSYRTGNSTTSSWFRMMGKFLWNGSANVCTTIQDNVDTSAAGSNGTNAATAGEVMFGCRPSSLDQIAGMHMSAVVMCSTSIDATETGLLDAYLATLIPT